MNECCHIRCFLLRNVNNAVIYAVVESLAQYVQYDLTHVCSTIIMYCMTCHMTVVVSTYGIPSAMY